MDLGQLALSFVAAVIGGGVVKLLDLAVERFRLRQQYKEKKILKLEEFVEEYADLAGYYHQLATKKSSLVEDEHGNFLLDERGEEIVETRVFELDTEVETAFESLYGVNIKGAIEQKKLAILTKAPRMLDIVHELGFEEQLKSRFTGLFWFTIRQCSSSLEKSDFDGLVNALAEARTLRREILAMLNKQLKK